MAKSVNAVTRLKLQLNYRPINLENHLNLAEQNFYDKEYKEAMSNW